MKEAVNNPDITLRMCLLNAFSVILLQISHDVKCLPQIALVLRCIDKETLAIIFRLFLLQSTILFSKGAFETPCRMITNPRNWSLVVNLIWLMVPTVFICSFVFCYIWLKWLPLPPENFVEDYQLAVKIVGASCVIKTLMEPVYVFAEAFRYVQLKEYTSYVSSPFMKINLSVCIALTYPEYMIRAIACGELAISIVCVILFWTYFYLKFKKKAELLANGQLRRESRLARLPFGSVSEFFPSNVFSSEPFLEAELAGKSMELLKHEFLKQIYTYGGQYVIAGSPTISFTEQGSYYAVIGLIVTPALSIFRYIEDQSSFYFIVSLDHDKPHPRECVPEVTMRISNALYKFIRISAFLGCGMFTFGLSYTQLIFHAFGGNLLDGWPVPILLNLGCLTILLEAINGVTSSYALIAMNRRYLERYKKLSSLLWWFSFLIMGLLSYVYGTTITILIWECCRLVPKIAHSIRFIHHHFQRVPIKPLLGLVPNKRQAQMLGADFAITLLSERFFYPHSTILHLACGALCASHMIEEIVSTEVGCWNDMRSWLSLLIKKIKMRA